MLTAIARLFGVVAINRRERSLIMSRVIGSADLEVSDFTARVNLNNLPSGEQIFYRVIFQDLADINTGGAPSTAKLRTPAQNGDILFARSGDTAGQGRGINPDFGGMKIYDTIRQLKPDFFIHSGDYIYADAPIESTVKLDDGSIWKNFEFGYFRAKSA